MSSAETVAIAINVFDCVVNYIEHVELVTNVQYTRRGALEIYLVSPQGTKVQLLSARPRDTSKAGLVNWPLTSVATWSEQPQGIWHVIIQDMTDESNIGEIGPISLIIHGTVEMPAHMKNGPRRYDNKYNSYQAQQRFAYLDSGGPYNENFAPFIPEQHSTEEGGFSQMDILLLDEVEKELSRDHHSKNYASSWFT